MKKISWKDKYNLALQETLSIKEIMLLRGVGQPKALKIRQKTLEYCLMNNIDVDCQRVPTDIVFIVTNHNLDYYYDKMKLEFESYNLGKNSKSLC